jgi:hypothetical protein
MKSIGEDEPAKVCCRTYCGTDRVFLSVSLPTGLQPPEEHAPEPLPQHLGVRPLSLCAAGALHRLHQCQLDPRYGLELSITVMINLGSCICRNPRLSAPTRIHRQPRSRAGLALALLVHGLAVQRMYIALPGSCLALIRFGTQAEVVVMVTREVEGGSLKCHRSAPHHPKLYSLRSMFGCMSHPGTGPIRPASPPPRASALRKSRLSFWSRAHLSTILCAASN